MCCGQGLSVQAAGTVLKGVRTLCPTRLSGTSGLVSPSWIGDSKRLMHVLAIITIATPKSKTNPLW